MFEHALQERFRGSEAQIEKRLSVYLPFLLGVPALTNNNLAIDMGCGRGEWLKLLNRNGFKSVGIDINEEEITRLHQANLNVFQSDALAFLRKVESASVSVITGFHIIEHIPFNELRFIFEEAFRCLVPGGYLIFETPNSKNIITATSGFYLDPTHLKPVPSELLEFTAEYYGFSRVKTFGLQDEESIKTREHVSLNDVFAGVSPDLAMVAHKKGPITEDAESLFNAEIGVSFSDLVQRFQDKINQIDQLHSLVSSQALQNQELGAWSTDVARRHAEEISLLHSRINALEQAFYEPYFIKRKLYELYWTITRLLGLSYLHDGTGKKNQVLHNLESGVSIAYWGPDAKIEDIKTKFAHLRLASLDKSLSHVHEAVCAPNKNKPRLAYVSPLPPLQTGIADYSAEILPYLVKNFEIDLFQPSMESSSFQIDGCGGPYSLDELDNRASLYDIIIYQIGNSPYHADIIPLTYRYAGIIVFHDIIISDLIRYIGASHKDPGFVRRSVYESHGFGALKELVDSKALVGSQVVEWPCTLPLLQGAQGIIFHSQYAKKQTESFYGIEFNNNCAVIPQHIKSKTLNSKDEARKKLGIKIEEFVICSFGFIGENKANHLLLEAVEEIRNTNAFDIRLYFVGEVTESPYCDWFCGLINNQRNSFAKITGFVDEEKYRSYLTAADVAVQLRKNSRGETSRSVLDCMAAGLPIIVNNHGSFTEISENHVLKLNSYFTKEDLVKSIIHLIRNKGVRDMIGAQAKTYVDKFRSPEQVAKILTESLTEFEANPNPITNLKSLVKSAEFIKSQNGEVGLLKDQSISMANKSCINTPPRILVDVSAMVRADLWTGIQRVVRAQVIGLIENPPPHFRIEPVYLDEFEGEWRHRHAISFTCKLLDIKPLGIEDSIVAYGAGDIYYMPDYYNTGVTQAALNGLYKKMKCRGVRINFLVHDILPIIYPDLFPPQTDKIHREWFNVLVEYADQIICVSDSVRQSILSLRKKCNLDDNNFPQMAVLPNGSDIEKSAPSSGNEPHNVDEFLGEVRKRTSFLMVGTIEPRKGYLQVLEAFKILWSESHNVNLIIVGKEGWKDLRPENRRNIPQTIAAILSNSELGRRLFWFDSVSDDFLKTLYGESDCLIAASKDEGFGLPLIEAAQNGLPVIARNIPVFREVTGGHAYFFEGETSNDLAQSLKNWMVKFQKLQHEKSDDIPHIDWRKNVEMLKKILVTR